MTSGVGCFLNCGLLGVQVAGFTVAAVVVTPQGLAYGAARHYSLGRTEIVLIPACNWLGLDLRLPARAAKAGPFLSHEPRFGGAKALVEYFFMCVTQGCHDR